MVGVRKSLDCVFEESELRILDDILPAFKREEQLDCEDVKVIIHIFLPAAINEVDGLRPWNDNSPPSLPSLPPLPPTICNIFKLF
jgi:hypothetical protein